VENANEAAEPNSARPRVPLSREKLLLSYFSSDIRFLVETGTRAPRATPVARYFQAPGNSPLGEIGRNYPPWAKFVILGEKWAKLCISELFFIEFCRL
jgi:hypothetical protein